MSSNTVIKSAFSSSSIVERYEAVTKEIAQAERDFCRRPGSVNLVCVSKNFPGEAIQPLLCLGHRLFGENRLNEAQSKWKSFKLEFRDICLHLIGPLQSNKVPEAVRLFDVIETVDRPKIALAIAEEIARGVGNPILYIQINIGSEAQKAGIAINEADEFIRYCRQDLKLRIEGLMCIPPLGEPVSPYFALLKNIGKRHDIEIFSMGMSSDFRLAIQLGSTHVRVGSAIFGDRTAL